MRVCDKDELLSICEQIGAPSATILTLEKVISRVFNDGFQALENNQKATQKDCDSLNRCLSCSCSSNEKIADIWCVDNDSWSKCCDIAKWGAEKFSADFFVVLNKNDSWTIQLVEAKLGVVSGGQEKRPRHPGPQELYDKYDWSVRRIGDGSMVQDGLIVLFSNSVIEKMKNRFSRFYRENRGVKIICMCVESYLESIGQGSFNHFCE